MIKEKIKPLTIAFCIFFLAGNVWAQRHSDGRAGFGGGSGSAAPVSGTITEYSNDKILVSTDSGDTSVYLSDRTKIIQEESLSLNSLMIGEKIVVVSSGSGGAASLIKLGASSNDSGSRNFDSPQNRRRRPGQGMPQNRPRQFRGGGNQRSSVTGSGRFTTGKVVSIDPLEIETSDGEMRKIETDDQTKVVREIEVGREALVPGQSIMVLSPPNSGSAFKVTIKASDSAFAGKSFTPNGGKEAAKSPMGASAQKNFAASDGQAAFGLNLRFGKSGNAKSNMQTIQRLYSESGVQTQSLSAYYQASVKMMQVVDSPGANQRYNWERRLDRTISRNSSSGIKSLIILAPYNGRAKMPKNLEHWKAFVTQVVKRYSDKKYGSLLYYALVNEPAATAYWNDSAENYALLLKATHEALKEANPSAKLVLGSIPIEVVVNQPSRQQFFKKVFNYKYSDGSSAEDYFDVVDIHIYDKPTSFKKYVDKVNSWLSRPKPMIMTETAGSSDPKYGGTLAKQAGEVIKRFVTAFGLGIQKVYWQPFNDHKALNVGGMDRFNEDGLLDEGLNPKPSYYTFQLMVNKLKGFSNIESFGEGTYKFSFGKREPVYVLWSEGAVKKVNMKDKINSSTLLVTHIIEKQGRTTPQTETVTAGTVTVSDSPIFVEAVGGRG